jgi:hypothetical protein
MSPWSWVGLFFASRPDRCAAQRLAQMVDLAMEAFQVSRQTVDRLVAYCGLAILLVKTKKPGFGARWKQEKQSRICKDSTVYCRRVSNQAQFKKKSFVRSPQSSFRHEQNG